MRKIMLFLLAFALACLLLSGCTGPLVMPDEPVKPEVTLHKEQIPVTSGEYCWAVTETEGICGDPPHPDLFYETVKEAMVTAAGGAKLKFRFSPKPETLYLSLIEPEESPEWTAKQNQYSYTIPGEPGEYIFKLSAVWDERHSAAYYFAVEVKR
ncbi:hypothetical protein NST84_18410 [Paenibacillus sp. FSL R7-0345]|uniref:hypothetical protein n=1 Tax=Paenibacillus sp. FSL R7-0345 TaxID=2954535 RepID=UPI00315A226C